VKAALFDTWISCLRKPHIWRQWRGELEDPESGKCCALGVLIRNDRWTKGLRRVKLQTSVDYQLPGGKVMAYTLSKDYLAAIGLDQSIADEVANMNDRDLEDGGSVPFPEIADWLERRRDAIVA